MIPRVRHITATLENISEKRKDTMVSNTSTMKNK